jgi:hypothetical protein
VGGDFGGKKNVATIRPMKAMPLSGAQRSHFVLFTRTPLSRYRAIFCFDRTKTPGRASSRLQAAPPTDAEGDRIVLSCWRNGSSPQAQSVSSPMTSV